MKIYIYIYIFSKTKDPLKVKDLPPTDQSAIEHVKRARLQVLIRRAAEQYNPPVTDISCFGWKIVNNFPVSVHGKLATQMWLPTQYYSW